LSTIPKTFIASFLWITMLLYCCETNNSFPQGEEIYKAYCASCHMEEGQGLQGLYPPLAKSDYLAEHLDEVPCLIVNGLNDTIVVNGKTYEIAMPAMPTMNAVQITNVMNYISQSWGNDLGYIKITDVETALAGCTAAQ
jgi:mono/diheme cytochrome c family protein